ncbi:MAG: C10 family peptidase [Bacteroidales bacterium]|nr:C10 family peptidase [Bacteroidales bacterium]
MKKKITILIILAFVICNFTFAARIEVKEAQKVALNFYYEMYNKFSKHVDQKVALSEIKLTEASTECLTKGIPDLYIFNVKTPYNEGFVVVTADDAATPVVGYSFEGVYSAQNQAPAFALFIDAYKKGVAYIRDNNIAATPEITATWNKYLNGNIDMNAKDILDVAPLLVSLWDQGAGWNAKCPLATGGPGGRAYAGCVSVATSQVMNYHMWPTQGVGTHTSGSYTVNPGTTTYLWNQMLQAQPNDPIETLLYHVGICLNMMYSATGSGAYNSNVPGVLTSHYKYANPLYTSTGSNPDATWKTRLRTQCDNRKPMVYGGFDGSDGHSWNCDGYQGTDYFHMNWGWSGSGNGFFLLTSLTAGGFNFVSNQQLVYDIVPSTGYPVYCSGSQTFTTPTGVFEDGSGYANYQANSNCSWLIDPTDSIATLKFTFERIGTEATDDRIIIYDGKTTAAPVLGTYSGATLPAAVTTTKPWALVTFTSDADAILGDGFRLGWMSNYPIFCTSNTNVTQPIDTIFDGSGGLDYNNNASCTWTITPSNTPLSIVIHWLTFSTEATNDKVEVWNNNVLPNVKLTTFSGTSLPSPSTYTCNTPKIKVKFLTNGTITNTGWSFWYEGVTSVQDRTGINTLSIYPVPANNVLNYSVMFDNVKNAKVKLINIIGETVYSENIGSFNGEYKQAIDVRNFAKGMYIMEINTDKGNMTQKVIID